MSNGHETGDLEVQQNSYTLWAAFRERTFEVVECPTDTRPVPSKYNKKCTYARKASIIFKKREMYILLLSTSSITLICWIYGMPKDDRHNIIHAHTRGYTKRAADRAALFVYTCYPMKERVGFPIAEYEEISPIILRKISVF